MVFFLLILHTFVNTFSRFLYAIFICLDANFRLKNNLTSNYSSDPGLGLGMAYMLPHGPYGEYVLSQADEEDVSGAAYLDARIFD